MNYCKCLDSKLEFSVDESQYCIRIVSGNSYTPGGDGTWKGSPLTLSRNGNTLVVLQSGFTKEDYCLAMDQVDQENDIFTFSVSGGDGVSDRISFLDVKNVFNSCAFINQLTGSRVYIGYFIRLGD